MTKELEKLLKKEKTSFLDYDEAMRVRELSPHFHSTEKGCKIIPKQQGKIQGAYCITHHKYLCHCGWEWRWHFGIYHSPEKYEWQKTQQKGRQINNK
jgi:hypothetical protein